VVLVKKVLVSLTPDCARLNQSYQAVVKLRGCQTVMVL
jgi:hypothetical protein